MLTNRYEVRAEFASPSGTALVFVAPETADIPVRLMPFFQGPPGTPGTGFDTDPGDFTLIFENQLV